MGGKKSGGETDGETPSPAEKIIITEEAQKWTRPQIRAQFNSLRV